MSTYRISFEPEFGRSITHCLEKKHYLLWLIPYWQYVPGSWKCSEQECREMYWAIKGVEELRPTKVYLD